MLRWLARFVLLRFLPARLVPILTVVEIIRMARALNRRRRGVPVNEPLESRTAPPPHPPSASRP
jgi:hypothetical protein